MTATSPTPGDSAITSSTRFNRDKPFDRFVVEQIAGDEIAPEDPRVPGGVDLPPARPGPSQRGQPRDRAEPQRGPDRADRHHRRGVPRADRRLCPVPQPQARADLAEGLLPAPGVLGGDRGARHQPRHAGRSARPGRRTSKRIKDEIKKLQAKSRKATGAEKARLAAEIEALEDTIPPPPATIPAVWNDSGPADADPRPEARGLGEQGRAGRPAAAERAGARRPARAGRPTCPTRAPGWPDGWPSPEHPLTARVIVNRLWQHHFGTGLVKTVNDFGTKGDRPSHPELLDWLAATLVENGWRLKPIHRLILLSGTYRQSSHRRRTRPKPLRQDPENRLLWRFNRRRLEAEEIRDAMLAVSGRLNARAGGPSVMVPVDPRIVQPAYKPSQWQVARDPAEHDRRSIYLIAKRNLRLPFLEAFDAPAPDDQLPAARIAAPTRRRRSSCSTAGCPTSWPRPSPRGSGARPAMSRVSAVRRAYRAGAGPNPRRRARKPSPWNSSATGRSRNSPWPCSTSMGSSMFPELPGPCPHARPTRTRREFIRDGFCGFGGLALAALLEPGASPGRPAPIPWRPSRRIIRPGLAR